MSSLIRRFTFIALLTVFTSAVTFGSKCAIGEDLRTCGAKSLHAVLASFEVEVTYEELVRMLPNGGKDASFQDLALLAEESFQLETSGLHWSSFPPNGSSPAIIPVAGDSRQLHFVTVLRWHDGVAEVQDGGSFARVTFEELRLHGWNGIALHFNKRANKDDVRKQILLNERLRVLCTISLLMTAGVLLCPSWLILKISDLIRTDRK